MSNIGTADQAFLDTVASQRAAAAPDTSAWVSANAGSGKTRVLTNRVIRLMLGTPGEPGAEPGRILSITFTKAAAAEMSNRLFTTLGEWATARDDALRKNLIELTGEDVGRDYPLGRARRLFASALETPGGLKIQTIHAFAESVLGRFPLEAGISPEAQVMDEAAAFDLMQSLKRDLLAGERAGPEVHSALGRMLDSMADITFDTLLNAAIGQRQMIGAALQRAGGPAAVAGELRTWLGLGRDDSADAVRAAGCRAGAFDELGLRRTLNALREDGGKTALANADRLDGWLASDDEGRAERFDEYCTIFLTQKGEPKKTVVPKGAIKNDPTIETVMAEEQLRILELADRMRAAMLADRTEDLLHVAAWLLEAYAEAKRRLSLLDYQDQIEKTLELLQSSADWVHFKLDQGIDHILIDEAQDTSPAQWEIADRLSAEFFVGDTARPNPRTVFAVGDEKQSIYSFQGADPEGFHRMRQHFTDRAAIAQTGFADLRLDLSFRSTPEVLAAVDRVFEGPAGAGLTASSAAITHAARRSGARGLVEVWPLEKPVDLPEPDRWQAPMDIERPDSPRRRLALRIARHIRRMIDGRAEVGGDGTPGSGRAVTPGDFLILVRRRDVLVEELSRALKQPDIAVPVAGADRMVLTNQIAVMDLIALGDFLLLPEDDLTLATVLKSPFYNLDDDDLLALTEGRPDRNPPPLWPILRQRADEQPQWSEAVRELEELLRLVDQSSPFAFYSELLSARGGRRRLHARLGADQMDPLDEFLNAALADERDHPPSLQGFLHRLRQSEAEIKRDMERGLDAVRIMTVHGAKGLEAPIVFLPDTARPPRAGAGPLLTLPDEKGALPIVSAARKDVPDRIAQAMEREDLAMLSEYRRLLYVAMTRAEDQLYVCGAYVSERARPSDDGWYRIIEEALRPAAEELEDGTLRIGLPRDAVPAETESPDTSDDLPSWIDEAPPVEPTPPRPLAPSRAAEGDPAVASPLARTGDQAGALQRGVLIHRLLEVLPDMPVDARLEAGAALLQRRAPDWTADARTEILAEAVAVLNDPDLAPAFAPGSRAEVPITGLAGRHVISGTVDRFADTGDAVWIVDYKTNRPPPDRVEDVSIAYQRQMALYRHVMQQIYPGRTIVAGLVWTYRTRLMRLPDAMLDRALASLDL